MTENNDSLSILLELLTPGLSTDEKIAIIRKVDQEQWNALIMEAEKQYVTPYLYTLLDELNRSHGFEIPQKEKLYNDYLSTTGHNIITVHSAELLLKTFQESDIPIAGLKGIYLLENIYINIGARAMNDIDILVRKKDLASSIDMMQKLGYKTVAYFDLADENIDTKHVPPMHNAGGTSVELHWTLLEEDEPFTIDVEALWKRTIPARIADVDVLALGTEDLILHLCLHLTYQHYLNLGLRGLMDIALVIYKCSFEINWQMLVEIAKSWGSQRVTALTLNLVETLLNVPIPGEVIEALVPEGIQPELLKNARSILLERLKFDDQFTPDLVELSASKNIFPKLKIGLQRIFIPRLAVARTYNVPPNSPRIMGLYWVRLKHLIRIYGKTIVRLQSGKKGTEPARQKAEISISLHEWLKIHGLDGERD